MLKYFVLLVAASVLIQISVAQDAVDVVESSDVEESESSLNSESSSLVKPKCGTPRPKCTKKNEQLEICPPPCPFKTCGIDDTLIDCAPAPVPGDPNCPPPACRCKSQFFRDDKGNCVPWDKCPVCPANEQYDPCDTPCPLRKCDVDPRVIKCAASPKLGDKDCVVGCRCIDGYARDKKGVCVPREQCPGYCPANEQFDSCDTPCPLRQCDVDPRLIRCAAPPNPGDKDCVVGCRCIDGYARDKNGVCVPREQCPGYCPANEQYDPCDTPCPLRRCDVDLTLIKCALPPKPGDELCVSGCRCIDGYARDANEVCIPRNQCPPKVLDCGPDEVYDPCPDCSPQTCETMNATYRCPRRPANNIGLGCKPSCRCKKGYYRNKIGQCISAEECSRCTGPHEYYSCGGACDNVCDTIREQNQTNCPIINVKCNEMCYCEEGYARDYKGECIPIKDCPVCPTNERYDPCPETLCGPKTCDEAGFPKNCTPREDGAPCPGKPGCVCRDGYLRDENGRCIQSNECPSCGGDKNATLGCGVNCNRHCSNVNQTESQACILVCYSNACDCRSDINGRDYYYDDNLKKCVLPEDCTVCPANEQYDPCDTPCPLRRCDVDPRLIRCAAPPNPGDKDCVVGCRCIDGYARDANGVCIPRKQCPPKVPNCGTNEVYDKCPDCSPQTCETMNAIYHCPLRPANNTGPGCNPSCRCKKGYYRNKIGQCISAEECSRCTGPHEFYSCGGACDNVCDTIKEQNQTNCPIINVKCNEMCYCEEGYARDYKGECIPIKDCPVCPTNERYDPCPETLCGPKTCDEAGFPKNCTPREDGAPCPGKPGCVCRDGYLRDENGRCIQSNECPSCGGDKNATLGCGVNCNRHCSNVNQTEPKACILICYSNACDCRSDINGRDYYYDDNLKKCVLPEDCTPQCKQNEVFSDCVNGGCGKQKCSDINKPVVCVHPKVCKSGCICAPGFLRAKNGTCVPSEKCDPPPKCKANEEFSKCGRDGCLKHYCSDLDIPPLCRDTFQCIPQCECKEGFLRASFDNDTCVPIEKCPRKCKKNEYLSECPAGTCQPKTCKEAGFPIPCPTVGPGVGPCSSGPGCLCNPGYLRNDKGICVPQQECPSCGGDDNAVPGCGGNCGNTCTTYNRTDIVCTLICKLNGCDCKKGYVYDGNVKKCVLPKNCSPTCQVNEEYSTCANSVCGQNCADKGKIVHCPLISDDTCIAGCVCKKGYLRAQNGTCVLENQCEEQIKCKENEYLSECPAGTCEPKTCKEAGFPVPCPIVGPGVGPCSSGPGCLCNPGYLRNDKGICIPQKECPSCGGDDNAVPGCGGHCGNTCTTYNRTDIACPLICNLNGCDCKKGYVYDGNVKKCVLPKNCSPTCQVNEEYSTCANGRCGQNCADKGKIVHCPLISDDTCTAGCVCKNGYLRAQNGTCVLENQCEEQTSCGGDENAVPGCGVHCGNTCDTYNRTDPIVCPLICNLNGCDCKPGYVFDGNLNKCVLPEKCTPTCKVNEVFSTCANSACGQSCADKGKILNCPLISDDTCTPGCICQKGYLRAQNGTCVPEDQCEQTCPEGEILSTCPPIKCDAEYCPKSRNSSLTCPIPKKCPSPRCVCGFNRHRNRKTGKCIATAQCPPFPCDGPNEKYQSCPPVCPGETCTDYLKNATCPKFRIGIVVPCKPACRCLKGYYRNSQGICISKNKCKEQTCKVNEEYSTCINGLCRPQKCVDKDITITCPKYDKTTCKGGCVCKKSFLRAKNGTCIPQDQCDESC
ncbi:zonadhesin-like [Ostrinia furnacalis]|uniref:zonadhesin-like n=1 Tax=Ostrinia furnacalis TaxID=93504 RepID=UPI00103E20D0|nr:zonadhesin-like [Ostrinia furnacalis]